MRLQELFSRDDLIVDFQPLDKWDAITTLLSGLRDRGRIEPEIYDEVLDSVFARERSMSTGMERGVAIPHAAVDGLEEAVATMAIVKESDALAFDSVDATPTRIVVLLLIPKAQKLLHIRTLADVARGLGKESVRRELIAASSPEEAWAALKD